MSEARSPQVFRPGIGDWLLLGSLYLSQYLGLGFFFTALIAILKDLGLPLEQVGLIHLLGLCWVFKLLWAPMVDRLSLGRLGHYRGWLLLTQMLMSAALLWQSTLDLATHLLLILALCVAVGLLSATQDIATDALACQMLPPSGRVWGSGIQVAGGTLGNLIGGGLVMIVYPWVGWQGALLLLALATALPLACILWFDETRLASGATKRQAARSWLACIRAFLQRPGHGRWLALLALYPMGINMAYALVAPMLLDSGWDIDDVGAVLNVMGSWLSVIAALVTGWVFQRTSRQRAVLLASVCQCLGIAALLLPALGFSGAPAVVLAVGAMCLLHPPVNTLLFALMMDRSSVDHPGSDYTLQFSVYALSSFVSAMLASVLAAYTSYFAALCTAIALAGLAPWLYGKGSFCRNTG